MLYFIWYALWPISEHKVIIGPLSHPQNLYERHKDITVADKF